MTLKCQKKDKMSNAYFCNEIQNDCPSACYLKWGLFELKQLCLSMEHLCSYVDLTDSNVMSVPLSVRRRENSQGFCRCVAHF